MNKAIAAIIIALVSLPAWGKVVRGYSTQSAGATAAVVDSIDFRQDLTRVYARLKGTPHTAARIDNITMQAGKTTLVMNDIDGIDAERWFQWEDTPYIPIEIDFAPIKNTETKMVFSISGPRGISSWVATPKTSLNQKKRK